ncbi:hypothetical protein [Halobacillus sp. A5]|uniref:hypothetical protein n=1 Tax=Halobacillus sp. A5 TaxID=2880263 RepID=UPI0020A64801|nr:hypothetical protein [Halobacillus sp. A5]MCP3027699.1 hypothetical protein [Halobacillus sp. A5]
MNISLAAFIPLIINIAAIGFIVWFAFTLLNVQRDRNWHLREISKGIQEIARNKND